MRALCISRKLNTTFFLNLIGAYHHVYKAKLGTESSGYKNYCMWNQWKLYNWYLQGIKKVAKSREIWQYFDAGLESIYNRTFPTMIFPQSILIQDDIEATAVYFEQAFTFIKESIEGTKGRYSFQIDFCISYLNTFKVADTDDFDDDDSDHDETEELKAELDVIGDIRDKLEWNELEYQCIRERHYKILRPLKAMLRDLCKTRGEDINKSRLITWIDRRVNRRKSENGSDDDNSDDKKSPHKILPDDVYLYEPAQKYSKLPDGDMFETWFHHTVKDYLLPGKSCNGITANTENNGQLLILSFHVRQQDESAVYLIYNGGMLRFEYLVCAKHHVLFCISLQAIAFFYIGYCQDITKVI